MLNLLRRLAPWKKGLLVLLLVIVPVGCTTVQTDSVGQEGAAAPSSDEVVRRYGQDQRERVALSERWDMQGVLDIEHPQQGRKNRIVVTAFPGDGLRLRIYGPFQQVALDLLLDPQWMHLIKLDSRQVIRVPATAEGMKYLTGYDMDPLRLKHFILGRADALLVPDEGLSVTKNNFMTEQGERVTLRAEDGLIQQRWYGTPSSGSTYQVNYRWSTPGEGGVSVPLPKRVAINLRKEKMILTFILDKWQFSEVGPAQETAVLPEGFELVEPDL